MTADESSSLGGMLFPKSTGKLPKDSPENLVLLIHGIRTEAHWTGLVRNVLEENSDIGCIPIGYGYFDIISFLCPVWTRRFPIKRVTRQIREAKARYPDSNLYIIAHSFGTYAITKSISSNPDFRLDGLILCGSILDRMYPWERYAHQVQKKVINEIGERDIWPLIANSVTWEYGPSGTLGFGNIHVRDRIHDLDHSGFFTADFVKKFWLPYIVDNKVTTTNYEANSEKTSWWKSILGTSFPILTLWAFVFILILYSVALIFFNY